MLIPGFANNLWMFLSEKWSILTGISRRSQVARWPHWQMCKRWQIECFYFSYLPSIRDRPEFPDSRSHPGCFSWRRALRHERPQPELPHQSHVRRIPGPEAGVLGLALHACPLLFAGPSPKLWSSLRSTRRSRRTKRYEEAAASQTHLSHWLQSVVQSVRLHLCCNLCWQIYDFASVIATFDLVKSGIFSQYETKKERQVSLLHTHRPSSSSNGKYLELKTSHVGLFCSSLYDIVNYACMKVKWAVFWFALLME